jgi:hypothetical protein
MSVSQEQPFIELKTLQFYIKIIRSLFCNGSGLKIHLILIKKTVIKQANLSKIPPCNKVLM